MNHPAYLYQAFFMAQGMPSLFLTQRPIPSSKRTPKLSLTLPMRPRRSRDWPWIACFNRRMARALMLFPGMR